MRIQKDKALTSLSLIQKNKKTNQKRLCSHHLRTLECARKPVPIANLFNPRFVEHPDFSAQHQMIGFFRDRGTHKF